MLMEKSVVRDRKRHLRRARARASRTIVFTFSLPRNFHRARYITGSNRGQEIYLGSLRQLKYR
jgi:hypothetical protein